MDVPGDIFKINLKNFNVFTLISLLSLIGGIAFWICWGLRFGVWYDIGVYALSIVLIVPGIIGTTLSLMNKKEEENY